VPIYVVACIVTVGLGFYASKTKKRGIYNLILMSVGEHERPLLTGP
jgi:hypothetical protein